MTTDLTPVAPAVPVAPYIGGKRLLANQIIQKIEALPHALYAEPFTGMGGVFLRRGKKPKIEVLNDISHDITNLFRLLQRHYPQFLEILKFSLSSRSEFTRLLDVDPNTLTDLERGARFLYLQRNSFGGKVNRPTYGTSATQPSRFNIYRIERLLEDVHERLSGVTIECLEFGEFIKRYDQPTTLFYLDPPYHSFEKYYGDEVFSPDDHARLARQLHGIQGRFILSINDAPEIRSLYGGCQIEEVELSYSASAAPPKKTQELLIHGP